MIVWGDWLCVELVDMGYVVGANCCDRLGGTCEANGCAVLVIVCYELGASILADVSRACILCESLDFHS